MFGGRGCNNCNTALIKKTSIIATSPATIIMFGAYEFVVLLRIIPDRFVVCELILHFSIDLCLMILISFKSQNVAILDQH